MQGTAFLYDRRNLKHKGEGDGFCKNVKKVLKKFLDFFRGIDQFCKPGGQFQIFAAFGNFSKKKKDIQGQSGRTDIELKE